MSIKRCCAVVVGSLVLGGAAPAAHAATPWLAPEPFAPAVVTNGSGGTSVSVAPDGTGVLGVDRHDGTGLRALVSSREVGQAPGAPEVLSSTATAVRPGSVRVALDAQGTTTAAWLRTDPAIPGSSLVEASRRPAGGAWEAAQVVHAGAVVAGSLSLAVGEQGRAVLGWVEANTGVGQRVWTARRTSASATFAAEAALSAAGASGDLIYGPPTVAMDAAGDYAATWQRYHDYGGGVRYVNEAVTVTAAGVAGTVRTLTSLITGGAGGVPSVAISSTGRALFVGDYYDGTSSSITVAEYVPGASFAEGTYRALPSLGTAPALDAAKVAVEPGGGAVLTWARGSIVVSSVRLSPDAAFSPPKDLSAPAQASSQVLAQGPSGDALVVWPVAGATSTTLVGARRRPGADTFGEVGEVTQAVPPTGGTAVLRGLSLGVDDQGNGLLTAVQDVTDAEGTHTYTPELLRFDAAPPVVTASVPASGTVGQPLSFAATATDRASSTTLAWDFGDGASGTGASPTHTYAAPGAYAVRVTATDEVGATAQAGGSVQVAAVPPATTQTGSTPPPATTQTQPVPPPTTTRTQAVPPPGTTATQPVVPPATTTTTPPTATFPLVGARVTLSVKRLATGRTRLDALRVDGLKRGDRIALRCTGSGCAKRATRTVTFRRTSGARLSLTSAVTRLRLAPGAKLSVGVSRAGSTARIVTFTMVRRKAPKRLERCVDPGTTRQRSC